MIVVGPTGGGTIAVFPGDRAFVPNVTPSILSFGSGILSMRSNESIIQVATDGSGTLGVGAKIRGFPRQVQVIIDIDGYTSK